MDTFENIMCFSSNATFFIVPLQLMQKIEV